MKGTILDATHILTASHCQVQLGDLIKYGNKERSGSNYDSTIVEINRHPDSERVHLAGMTFDYAILVVDPPIELDLPDVKAVEECFQMRLTACTSLKSGP